MPVSCLHSLLSPFAVRCGCSLRDLLQNAAVFTLYGYVHASPLVLLDPFGERSEPSCPPTLPSRENPSPSATAAVILGGLVVPTRIIIGVIALPSLGTGIAIAVGIGVTLHVSRCLWKYYKCTQRFTKPLSGGDQDELNGCIHIDHLKCRGLGGLFNKKVSRQCHIEHNISKCTKECWECLTRGRFDGDFKFDCGTCASKACERLIISP